MKHYFVINPVAGKKDDTERISNELRELAKKEEFRDLKYEIYVTKSTQDALNFVRDTCTKVTNGEKLRFYACGGDGTINEVANGAYGFPNVSFTCFPCGSGNDFVKAFKGKDFTNIEKLITGEEMKIDLINVNDRICININNIGFDAAVAYNMVKFKKWPLVTGKGAYKLGLIKSLFREMKHYADIFVDGVKVDLDGFLLACACNGICCGGSYYCSPKSIINDGILDVIAIKHISVFKFLKMVSKYQDGTYQEDEKVMQYVKLYKAKEVKIISQKKEIVYGLDGESFKSKEINVKVMPSAINFIVPRD